MLRVIRTDPTTAAKNMQIDINLLNNLKPQDAPILHFYEWKKKAATYGYFIKPEKYLNLRKVKEKDLDLARRPTGGGIVFHIWDMAFSFLLPAGSKYFYANSLENYQFVNQIAAKAVGSLFKIQEAQMIEYDVDSGAASFNFCMAKPTKYDVVINNKKLIGASQRKKKNGYLHQGTIALGFPDVEYLQDLILEEEVYKSIIDHSFDLLKNFDIKDVRASLSMELIQKFKDFFCK